jgi:hypothetical protein
MDQTDDVSPQDTAETTEPENFNRVKRVCVPIHPLSDNRLREGVHNAFRWLLSVSYGQYFPDTYAFRCPGSGSSDCGLQPYWLVFYTN